MRKIVQNLCRRLRISATQRRRRSGRAGSTIPAALIDTLESRELLAATVGPVLWQSGALGLDDIRGAAASADGGEVRIVGQDEGSAAMQRIGLPASPTGTLAPDAVQLFWSLSQTANGGGSGFSGGMAHEIVYRPDGSWLVVGDSQDGGVFDLNRTFWLTVSHAQSSGLAGVNIAATSTGVIGGFDGNSAVVGSITQPMTALINSQPGQGIADITPDSRYLVGQQIYRATNVSTLTYTAVDTSSWQVPAGALGQPSVWRHVAQTSSGVFFAGEVTDSTTFTSRVGVWREDGTLLGVTDLGDTLADMTTVEGQLVLTVNGTSGGTVYLPTTTGPTAGLGERIDLSSHLGTSDDTIVPDTTFSSELGMIITTGGENQAVSFDFLVTPDAITVPSAVHQGSYNANVISTKVSTFEVGLKGSATFDVTKIDKASLFIGDERNTVSGKITSIKYIDTNKDGFKDAIIKVQTTGAVRTDTTRLKITGKTTTGDDFDGSLNVTSTLQTWQAHWQSTNGAAWKTAYTLFTKGLKKTWW